MGPWREGRRYGVMEERKGGSLTGSYIRSMLRIYVILIIRVVSSVRQFCITHVVIGSTVFARLHRVLGIHRFVYSVVSIRVDCFRSQSCTLQAPRQESEWGEEGASYSVRIWQPLCRQPHHRGRTAGSPCKCRTGWQRGRLHPRW